MSLGVGRWLVLRKSSRLPIREGQEFLHHLDGFIAWINRYRLGGFAVAAIQDFFDGAKLNSLVLGTPHQGPTSLSSASTVYSLSKRFDLCRRLVLATLSASGTFTSSTFAHRLISIDCFSITSRTSAACLSALACHGAMRAALPGLRRKNSRASSEPFCSGRVRRRFEVQSTSLHGAGSDRCTSPVADRVRPTACFLPRSEEPCAPEQGRQEVHCSYF